MLVFTLTWNHSDAFSISFTLLLCRAPLGIGEFRRRNVPALAPLKSIIRSSSSSKWVRRPNSAARNFLKSPVFCAFALKLTRRLPFFFRIAISAGARSRSSCSVEENKYGLK